MLAGLLLTLGCAQDAGTPRRERPNVLIVTADDLGYSDIGPYGSEIDTPTLDALADRGLLATQFYVAPDGQPTLAMLLTGVDHHRSGFGGIPARTPHLGAPGYEGYLNGRVATLATLLRRAGYRTYAAGRWELGEAPAHRPAARGFDESFVLLDPAASHWADMRTMTPGRERALYSRNGTLVDALPEDHYSSRAFTDFLIDRIDAGKADGRPFFALLSYQAPHSPLAVPEDWEDRYAGRYDQGYQAVRRRRLDTQKRRGLVRTEVVPFPGLPTIPQWDELSDEQRRGQARRMELYAAMVESLDHQLGRLLAHLDEIGELDDTLVFFLSDNGPSASDRGPEGRDLEHREWLRQTFPDSEISRWGRPGSWVELGAGWAQVSATPFRLFKRTQAEGGVRSPLLVAGPGVAAGRVTRAVLHVTDLPATVLDRAAVGVPDEITGRSVLPLDGRSFAPLLAGEEPARWGRRLGRDAGARRRALGFELDGDSALRRGVWKAVRMAPPLGTGEWQLFRLDRDPSELFDRAQRAPDILEELKALWTAWADDVGVITDDTASPAARR